MAVKLKARLGLCASLCLLAVLCAAGAIASTLSRIPAVSAYDDPQGLPEYTANRIGYDGIYVLREYNGHVAVFSLRNELTPETVTSIEVDGLRGVDRDLLEQGITAKSYAELLLLLEDLGS